MSNTDIRVPAFPGKVCTGHEVMSGDPMYEHPHGMTLRDYFAAKAMQAMIGMISTHSTSLEVERIPQSAYSYADDMMEEREE